MTATTNSGYPDRATQIIITISVMLVAVIEVLDMTIVNVALPPMMGALGANSDEITWVLTAYIVSSAIVMPLTGLLVKLVGRRTLLLIDIAGFLTTSLLCGLSVSLAEMVFLRTLQGIFGASLIPLSQYILRDIYPPEKHGKAMAVWGVGIMVAPVLGPTLGGYITSWINWRWIFFINVPVCIIAFSLTLFNITETVRENIKIDWHGLILMIIGIGCLQIVLDRGNSSGWFSSNFILITSIASAIGLITFISKGIQDRHNIIDLQLFRYRNFWLCCTILLIYTMGIIGMISIQPILLENLFNYNAQTAGLAMAPRAIASALTMIAAGFLTERVDNRWLILTGILFTTIGSYLTAHINMHTSFDLFAWYGFVQGLGMGLVFTPLSTLALSEMAGKEMAEGAGLFSFSRSIGSSIGISILSTTISRETQVNWNQLGGHLTTTQYNFQRWLQLKDMSITNPQDVHRIAQTLHHHATMVAFVDTFWLVTLSSALLLPFVFFLKRAHHQPQSDMPNH